MTPNKSLLLAAVTLLLFVAPLHRIPNGQRNASALPPFLNGKTWGGCPEIFRPLRRNRPAQRAGTLDTDTPH
jgi:hypothetical protein